MSNALAPRAGGVRAWHGHDGCRGTPAGSGVTESSTPSSPPSSTISATIDRGSMGRTAAAAGLPIICRVSVRNKARVTLHTIGWACHPLLDAGLEKDKRLAAITIM